MTGPSASGARRCTWLWTRSATCSPCTSPRPTSATGLLSSASRPTSRMRPAKASSSPTSIRATRERRPPMLRQPRASRCTSSSCPKRSGLRAAAAALGRGTVLCVGNTVPPAGQGLRALRHNARRLPRHRIRRIHAQTCRQSHAECITPSSRRLNGRAARSCNRRHRRKG